MTSPLVFVSVGTDHHPFDRLVAWAAAAAAADPDVEWLVQTGSTTPDPTIECVTMLGVEDLNGVLERARVVITHGGPGLILESRAFGHVPIVVPRDPELGEHVDNHQQLFTRRLASDGRIRRVTTSDEFASALSTALAEGPQSVTSADRLDADETVARFGQLVDDLVKRKRR